MILGPGATVIHALCTHKKWLWRLQCDHRSFKADLWNICLDYVCAFSTSIRMWQHSVVPPALVVVLVEHHTMGGREKGGGTKTVEQAPVGWTLGCMVTKVWWIQRIWCVFIDCISLFCLPYILCMMCDVESVWVVCDADVFVRVCVSWSILSRRSCYSCDNLDIRQSQDDSSWNR